MQKTEMVAPNLHIERKDIEDPRWRKSMTESADPKRALPMIETDDPRRAKLRSEIVAPK
jgi:hypothetical protein